MYIRFETDLTFQGTSHRKGIFAAMGDLKRMGRISAAEQQWYQATASWFNENLKNPTCFDPPIPSHIRFSAKSWFLNRPSAFLCKSAQVADLLRKYDIHVDILQSDSPGEIIYRDDLQIVVWPCKDPA